MAKNLKFCFWFSSLILLLFFTVKILVLLGTIPSTSTTRWIEFICLVTFIPLFTIIVRRFSIRSKENLKLNKYTKKLNETIITQSHDHVFYNGDISQSAINLTEKISKNICVERVSIWLYNEDKTLITSQKLYQLSKNEWSEGDKLYKKDYEPYFKHLETDPIVIANNAETHPATSCFKETYLKPLGIKSMLDVPIVYRGKVIGVICVESLTEREWLPVEVDFVQMVSSLYSLTFSIKDGDKKEKRIIETEQFISKAALISITDAKGKIIFVNDKFCEVSGWSLEESVGKDHNIVNSGFHPKEFWADMYKTVLKGEVWNKVVTNKRKNGELYYVDSYVRARFSDDGKLEGFSSIRHDVTELVKQKSEIEKKNTYLEHAAKILRHDMHSGINTYIPRGITSLERRLTPEDISRLKIESPLKMIKEGLLHSQKVYKGVYEFTNLVKKDKVLTKTSCDLKQILESYLSTTAYKSQVLIDDLPTIEVNEPLFCTAVDNLIRNGLKYNDSNNKFVKIYMEDKQLIIQDNGRGLTQEEFDHLSKPYIRKQGQKETGSGLGLNICNAILNEHGFKVSCEKNEIGTKLKIEIH